MINCEMFTDVFFVIQDFVQKFPEYKSGSCLAESGIQFFLHKLDKKDVVEAMKTACKKMDNPETTMIYFCGLCFTKFMENRCTGKETK